MAEQVGNVVSTALVNRAKEVTEREKTRYAEMTPGSQEQTARAKRVLPLGVGSNLQFFDPHPIVVERARGSEMWDVDGNRFIDYNLGYGSLIAGHSHPLMVEALNEQLEAGTLYVTPNPVTAQVAENLCRRFPFDMVRFTNSGTESTLDSLRLARGVTGRDKIIKLEGGYHGHHDLAMISVKPPLEKAGPAEAPYPVPMYLGVGRHIQDEVIPVPYNDADALEQAFRRNEGQVAAFLIEPVMQNIGIVEPVEGYLEAAAEITRKHGALLIFDEVKTGITAHPRGAHGLTGVEPDIICLAKSIGGGVPVGAFGARRDIMEYIADGRVAHMGTFNANPLVMAAARAVLRDIVTDEAWAEAKERNDRLIQGCDRIIAESGIPAHTVQVGAKGCVTYYPEPLKNYRDFKKIDVDLAYAHWIYMMTHGIFLPPGLDDQWLVSVQHTDEDIDRHLEVFQGFVDELTA
jgi:glutamate-1-semialdehyde 2,1-aminomutase